MAGNIQYELGTLFGNSWRQWATVEGQDYYELLSTGATQFAIPNGFEDAATDAWQVDNSKGWTQWRNARTGRIRLFDPNPPAPQTYLDKITVGTYLRDVERVPESHEYMYRRVMLAILRHFFSESEGFDVIQEESRGAVLQNDTRADMVVLKILRRPGGSIYMYDYCIVESKRANQNWANAQHHLSRHCEGTEAPSQKVYAIAQIGLYLQFFTAKEGNLTALSGALHVRTDVNTITAWLEHMKRNPLA